MKRGAQIARLRQPLHHRGRGHGDRAFLAQGFAAHAPVLHLIAHKAQIAVTLDQALDDLRAVARLKPHPHAILQQGHQQQRRRTSARKSTSPMMHRARHFGGARPRRGQRRSPHPAGANAGGQFVGSGGGLHAMHAALEQRAADGGLQPGDMLRHGRLRQIKAARAPLIERWR
jgi:hypothetical protein